MVLRDLIFDNLRWKVAALILAIFTWSSIQLADWRNRKLEHQRVQVLTPPGDARSYRVSPAEVDVVLRATSTGARLLERRGIQVFVDLTDGTDGLGVAREPQVSRPEGIEVIKVEPKLVYVERISTMNDSATNSLAKP